MYKYNPNKLSSEELYENFDDCIQEITSFLDTQNSKYQNNEKG